MALLEHFFFLAFTSQILAEHSEYLKWDGGWLMNRSTRLLEEKHCTVERRGASLTYAEFIQQYAFLRPVIIQGLTDNSEFQALCTKERLLEEYGEHLVRLSTANTYSYQKVNVRFREYVEHLLKPQDQDCLGSDTLYFFGDNNFTEWGPLFEKYSAPPFQIPGTSKAYSFGIAGSGTGVPFHWHGPGFSEVIFGRKRWFLYPPEKTPEFNPNRTTLSWLMETYPLLLDVDRPLECTIHPGAVLSGSLVACNTKPGHQRVYLHFPGMSVTFCEILTNLRSCTSVMDQ